MTDVSGLPLDGYRVVEVASFVAAPLAGLLLAELGAEVIRVDPIGGAPDTRRWPLAPGGSSLYWNGLNQRKRSVTVDLASAAGVELVKELVAAGGPRGGVMVTNCNRPGLSARDLQSVREDVIHVRLEGMPDGSTAVDYTVNAGLGYADMTGPAGGSRPVNHVFPAWDVIAGHQLALTVLAAVMRRIGTGRGTTASIALWDVALASAARLGVIAEVGLGGPARPADGNHVYGTFGHDFSTRDGERIMVVALTSRHWRSVVDLCDAREAIDALERALDVSFSDDGDRYRHRDLLVAVLRPWFAEHDLADIEEALAQRKVLHSRFRSFAQLAADLEAGTAPGDLLTAIDQPGIGRVLAPGSVVRDADGARVPGCAAPALGGDTDAVLEGVLRFPAAHIAELRVSGVVA